MIEHNIGDLVMYRGTLGYIKAKTKTTNDVPVYRVYWFNPKVEDDISNEWDDTLNRMKDSLNVYLQKQNR
jgi:hypothetical protein